MALLGHLSPSRRDRPTSTQRLAEEAERRVQVGAVRGLESRTLKLRQVRGHGLLRQHPASIPPAASAKSTARTRKGSTGHPASDPPRAVFPAERFRKWGFGRLACVGLVAAPVVRHGAADGEAAASSCCCAGFFADRPFHHEPVRPSTRGARFHVVRGHGRGRIEEPTSAGDRGRLVAAAGPGGRIGLRCGHAHQQLGHHLVGGDLAHPQLGPQHHPVSQRGYRDLS